MKSIILCRVSSKEQEETGYSLDAQEKLLSDYAQKKGFDNQKIFKISESASGKQIRKSFNEIFKYVLKHNINIILCEKIDRLTRNMKDAVMVSDWLQEGELREIHFVKENFIVNKNTRAHENLVWDMKIAIARFYTNNLSEEVRKGQKEKIAQGWLPTKPPLGYKTVGDKGHKIHVIDDEKSFYIIKLFQLYSSGNYSINELVRVIHSEGLRNRVGKKVGKTRLHEMLSDPFYRGKMKWKGEIHDAKHEPLITKELFDAVQLKLNRGLKNPHYKKHSTVFKAKIACDECGGTITWEIQKGNWYGHCNHYKACSQSKWWKQEDVEEKLFPLFDKVAPKGPNVLRVLEKALKESHSDEIKYHDDSLKKINRVIETAQRRIESIYEDKIDGKITLEFYDRKFKEYTQTKEEGLAALKKLDEGNTKYYQVGFAIHELASRAAEIYKSPKASIEEKRLLLSKVFSNLSLNDLTIKPNYTFAFQFLLEWMPKVNATFELIKNGSSEEGNDELMLTNPVVLPRQDSNLRPIA